jgi:hypothetical protein
MRQCGIFIRWFLDTIADKYTGVIEFQISLGFIDFEEISRVYIKKRDTWPVLMFQKIAIQVVLPRLWIRFESTDNSNQESYYFDFYTEQQLSRLRQLLVLQGRKPGFIVRN